MTAQVRRDEQAHKVLQSLDLTLRTYTLYYYSIPNIMREKSKRRGVRTTAGHQLRYLLVKLLLSPCLVSNVSSDLLYSLTELLKPFNKGLLLCFLLYILSLFGLPLIKLMGNRPRPYEKLSIQPH